jgi:RHS repeat-associated protein
VADSTVASEDRNYGYDAGWNLNKRTNNLTVHTFTVNNKNELTSYNGSTFTYDSNGNLIVAGSPSYTYDAENQLVSAQVTATWRSEFTYDGRGRLRKRIDYSWTGSSWYPNDEIRYLYDGMRVIQERDSGNTPKVAYTRGSDLSGSLEGAGGIGGLLARSHGYSSGSLTNHNCYHADGGGNVTYLVNSSQGVAASYRYDPYGNTISSSGSLASANVYRFSSKPIHVNSGMYYYGYRFYDPNLQRWLNRDPIGEKGGINLYAFVWNAPFDYLDSDGRAAKGSGPRKPGIGQPGYVTPLPPEFENCNENQRMMIVNGTDQACENIDKKCFEDCLKDPALVQALREKCKNKPRFRCDNSAATDGCSDGSCAFTTAGGGLITICPPGFDASNCPGPGCLILHELGHAAGAEGDRANDVEKCWSGCSQNPPPHPKK